MIPKFLVVMETGMGWPTLASMRMEWATTPFPHIPKASGTWNSDLETHLGHGWQLNQKCLKFGKAMEWSTALPFKMEKSFLDFIHDQFCYCRDDPTLVYPLNHKNQTEKTVMTFMRSLCSFQQKSRRDISMLNPKSWFIGKVTSHIPEDVMEAAKSPEHGRPSAN